MYALYPMAASSVKKPGGFSVMFTIRTAMPNAMIATSAAGMAQRRTMAGIYSISCDWIAEVILCDEIFLMWNSSRPN